MPILDDEPRRGLIVDDEAPAEPSLLRRALTLAADPSRIPAELGMRGGAFSVAHPAEAASMGVPALLGVAAGIASGGTSVPVQLGAQALAGAAGDAISSKLRGEPIDPRTMALSAGTQMVPIAGGPAAAAAKGALVSELDMLGRSAIHGQMPTAEQVVTAPIVGGIMAGGGAMIHQGLQGVEAARSQARARMAQDARDVAGGTEVPSVDPALGVEPDRLPQGQTFPRTGLIVDDEAPTVRAPESPQNLSRPLIIDDEAPAAAVQAPPAAAPPAPTQMGPPPESTRYGAPEPARGTLAQHAPAGAVYRETNLEGLQRLLTGGEGAGWGMHVGSMGREDVYLASSRDLALGQGENKGVVVELDPSKLNGRPPRNQKPGAAMVAQSGGGQELLGIGNSPHDYLDAVRSIEAPAKFSLRKPGTRFADPYAVRARRALDDLVAKGWTVETVGDRAIYRPPGATPAQPEAPGLPTQQAAPGAASLKDLLKRAQRDRAAGAAAITQALDAGVSEFTNERGFAAAITPDPSKPGRWRVTRADNRGLSGHTEAETREHAIREALDDGFTTPAPGRFDELASAAESSEAGAAPDPLTLHSWLESVDAQSNRRPYVPLTDEQSAWLKGAGLTKGKAGKLTDAGRSQLRDLGRDAEDLRLAEGNVFDMAAEGLDFAASDGDTLAKFGRPLPEGYVRQGDVYTRNPQLPTQQAATSATEEPQPRRPVGGEIIGDAVLGPRQKRSLKEALARKSQVGPEAYSPDQTGSMPQGGGAEAPRPDIEITRGKESTRNGYKGFDMRSPDRLLRVENSRYGWAVTEVTRGSSTTAKGKYVPAESVTHGDHLSRADAIDVAEKVLRGEPSGIPKTPAERYAAIQPPESYRTTPAREQGSWNVDRLMESPAYMTDGHSLIARSELDQAAQDRLRGNAAAQTEKPAAPEFKLNDDVVTGIVADVQKKGKPVETVGVLPSKALGSSGDSAIVVRNAKGDLIGLNADKVRLMQRLTGATEMRSAKPEGPVGFYRDGKLIGAVMPLRLPELEAPKGVAAILKKKAGEERGSFTPPGAGMVSDLLARGRKYVGELRAEGEQQRQEALAAELSARRQRPFPGAVGDRGLGPGVQIAPGTDRSQPAVRGRMSSTQADSFSPSIIEGDINGILNRVGLINRDDVEFARRGKVPVRLTQMRADELASEWYRRIGADAQKAAQLRERGQTPNAEEMLAMLHVSDQYGARSIRKAAVAEKTGSLSDTLEAAADAATSAAVTIQAQAGATELGRAMNILRKAAYGPEGAKNAAIRQAVKYFGGEDKLAEIVARIRQFKPEEVDLLNQYMAKVTPKRWGDKLLAGYYFSLLANAPGRVVDFVSTGANSLRRPLTTVVAAGYDAARSAATGEPRTRFAAEAAYDLMGHYAGLRLGGRTALRTFLTQQPQESFSRFREVESANRPFKTDLANTLAGIPRAVIEASDDFWKEVTGSGYLWARAARQASLEGRTGDAWTQRVAEIIEDPRAVDQLLQDIHDERQRVTFQQPLGDWSNKFLGLINHEIGTKPGSFFNDTFLEGVRPARFIMPFYRTTVNLQKLGFGDTFALPSTMLKAARGRLPADQGERADLLARTLVASTIAAAGLGYIAQGFITGPGPLDPREAEALRATGWKPNSVNFGGNDQYEYRAFEPVGTTLGLLAGFHDAFPVIEHEDSKDRVVEWIAGQLKAAPDTAGKLAAVLTKQVMNAPYVKGLSDVYDAVHDPKRYLRSFANNQVAAFIPGITKRLAQAEDPTIRQPRTLAQTLQARIPGLTGGGDFDVPGYGHVSLPPVPPLIDIWGRDMIRKGGFWELLTSPAPRSELWQDPASRAIRELGWKPGSPSRALNFAGAKVPLPDGVYERYARRVGAVAFDQVTSLVTDGTWSQLDDQQKRKALSRAWKTARKIAKAEVLGDLIELREEQDQQ